MSKHHANATWEGNLTKGEGTYTLQTSGYKGNVRFTTRFEDDKTASSPEELIAAALSSCFSMALAHALDQAGFTPEKVETSAEVNLTKGSSGFSISDILLKTRCTARGIEKKQFDEIAEKTKQGCPVSRALAGTSIKLEAELVKAGVKASH